jgi:hypothetical protein
MLKKIEVGMKVELTFNEKTAVVEILNVPENKDEKILVRFVKSGKEKEVSYKIVANAKRFKEQKEKKASALSIAMEVLAERNEPMSVKEICEAVLAKGYSLPREGKTFNCSMSTRLNTAVEQGKVKKLAKGIFAHADFDGEFTPAESKKAVKAREKAELEKALAEELADVMDEE